MAPKEECSCCSESKLPSQFKKFSTCQTKPCNTVCNFCWTHYLKTDFMEDPTKELACFMCSVPMDKPKVLQLLLRNAEDRKYYDYRLGRAIAVQNGERECIFGDCKNDHVQVNGRVSFCGWCSRQACIVCGVPEHFGESCGEFNLRVFSIHAHEEAATTEALAEGYSAREEVGKEETTHLRSRTKRPLPCPSCGIWIERFGGCLRLRCPVCSLDFCGSCAAPYLGRDSVPLKGNAAHHETCHYFKRKVEDRRFRPASRVESRGHANAVVVGEAESESEWQTNDQAEPAIIGSEQAQDGWESNMQAEPAVVDSEVADIAWVKQE